MSTLLLAVHLAASAALAAFGYHRASMARRFRLVGPAQPDPHRAPISPPPTVTVQIPLYNERYVAERAVRAAAALDYPRDRFEIQILDDSDDDTSEKLAPIIRELRAGGIAISHVRRAERVGYKAGALQHGLITARGELIAIFDGDFVPHSDFLNAMVPEFRRDDVALVQARWGHLNRDASLLTRVQALQLDAHFTLEHGVRAAQGHFFNFNGTAGMWRRRAIVDAGGWHADTLTEDLDLSYRAQLKGWRFVYRDDVEVPAEVPVEVAGYRQQQQRWAQGGVQTAVKLLPAILGAPIAGSVKIAALWHLLIHFSYPLLVAVTMAGLGVGLGADLAAFWWVVAIDGLLLTFAMTSLAYFYGVAARARHPGEWVRRLWLVPAIMVLGAGISFAQTLAVARGLFGTRTPFRRTPKYLLATGSHTAWRNAAYRIPTGSRSVLEIVAGIVLLVGAAWSGVRNDLAPSSLVVLLGLGLISVGGTSLAQHAGKFQRSA